MAGGADYSPLSSACVRALSDKVSDKRKAAATEIEKLVRESINANNPQEIKRVIAMLEEYAINSNVHTKKGGLIGLAAVAVGLGTQNCSLYIGDIVTPIVSCLSDQNTNVRYAAAESLYNVVRVARQSIFEVFEQLFTALTVLVTDPDNHVRVGAGMLNTTMKAGGAEGVSAAAHDKVFVCAGGAEGVSAAAHDKVFVCAGGAEGEVLKELVQLLMIKCLCVQEVLKECSCSLEPCFLISVLRPKLTSNNSTVQVLLVSWLSLLQSIPSLDLVLVLTDILDPLMRILDSPHLEVIKEADALLSSLLESCHHHTETVDCLNLTPVLLEHAVSSSPIVQDMSLLWLSELLTLGGRSLLSYAAPILSASLPCFAEASSSKTKDVAKKVSEKVMALLQPHDDELQPGGDGTAAKENTVELQPIVIELLKHVMDDTDQCKFLVLRWLCHMMHLFPGLMQSELERVSNALLPVLRDRSDVVVVKVLVLLATLSVAPKGSLPLQDGDSPPHLDRVLELLVEAFSRDQQLLVERGQLILRQLCVLLSPTQVYERISKLLQKVPVSQNSDFLSMMAHTMATILITSKELFPMRLQLRKLETKDWCDVFASLFKCWSHNSFSVILLCLLSQNYRQSAQLVSLLGDGDITVDFLVEVDKLVQLLESPIFTYLRLDLLRNDSDSTALLETLYGLLMILPQSSSYTKLATRLSNLPAAPRLVHDRPSPCRTSQIDFDELLGYFKEVHEKKRLQKQLALVNDLHTLARSGDFL
ncbi:Vacuole morphology and inheritance protein 14 Fab1-binding region [Trinorchestia longiramus]|nr:Vacuole morphology and inheritance protein 14 Fab1-binding region [Trinorchestia longiramus]